MINPNSKQNIKSRNSQNLNMWGLKYNKHIIKICVAPPASFGILLLL
jgi:hypothetical protein